MLERIVYAISFAVEQGVTVAFFGVDGTRADPGYFETVYKTAIEAGAQEAVVVDTIGIASPEAVGRPRRPDEGVAGRRTCRSTFTVTTTSASPTAAALAAVRAGASWIQGTVNGMGERAGNANLPEIALALRGLYGVETNLPPRPSPRLLRAAARSLGLRARAVQAVWSATTCSAASRVRSPASSTIRRRSSRTPPSSSPRSGASSSARRAGSIRSASRRRSWGLDLLRRRDSVICSHASRSSGQRSAGSSRTTSSASSRVAEHDAVLVGSGINSLACARIPGARRLARGRPRTRVGARRRCANGRAHRAGLPPRRVQRVASALGRRPGTCGARRALSPNAASST